MRSENFPRFFLFFPTVASENVTQICTGLHFACARSGLGSVKCWGSNRWGKLGVGLAANDKVGNWPGDMGDSLQAVALGTGRNATMLRVGSSSVGWGGCIVGMEEVGGGRCC